MSKNAMRQALDALELHATIEGGYCSCCGHQPCLKTCSVIQAIEALRAALDVPDVPDVPSMKQALTDTENQPNQYGVSFGMRGPQMTFGIGNQRFTLAYEPDEPGEFEFMRNMLIHAMSVFTPDVKTTEPLSDARIIDIAINLKRPSPHECTPVFLTGSNLGYRRFRSAGDHAHVNADDLLLFVRAVEQEVRGK